MSGISFAGRHAGVLLAGVLWPTVARRADRLYFADCTLSDVDTSAPRGAVPKVGEHVA